MLIVCSIHILLAKSSIRWYDFFTEHSLERCKSMEVHSTTTIHRSVNKSLRITSVRRHGGGGFAGHNIEKEVNMRNIERLFAR